MNRRILFTDLDGTLLDDEKNITPGNRSAIEEALAQGHILVIATGRPLASARPQAEALGLTGEGCYGIAFNGAQIYDFHRKETIYSRPLAPDVVRPLFQAAAARGLHIQTYSDTHVLAEKNTTALQTYVRIGHLPFLVSEDISRILTAPPYKLLVIDYQNQEPLLQFQKEVLSSYAGLIDSFFSSENYLEIVPAGISKGFAVRWLCQFLNIPLENSVAAGDAQNDISMLEAAGTGAVMRNAYPGIAEHGTYVTENDNNHDGVAEIIRRFILNKTDEPSCCSGRKKHREMQEYRDLMNRLKRIEGQVRGIQGMLEEDRYCVDILTQVSAVQSALNSFTKLLLSNHIKTCVVKDIREGKEAAVDELCATIQKLMR